MTAPSWTESPTVRVTADLVSTLVHAAGYTHPLFSGRDAPLMGQGLLLLAGGLAEQTGALDHAVALVGLEDVRFRAMARPGTSISLRMRLLDATATTGGKGLERWEWTVLDTHGTALLEAVAVLLVRPLEGSATQ